MEYFQDTTFLNRKEVLRVLDRFLQIEPSLKKGKTYFFKLRLEASVGWSVGLSVCL